MLDEVKTKVKKFAKENKNELICSAVIAGVGVTCFMLGVKGERTQTAKLIAELEAICNDSWAGRDSSHFN